MPRKLGELADAMARVLELHMKALDLGDPSAKVEHAAYNEVSRDYRGIAARLAATARDMAGYEDLPIGRHDPEVMAAPENAEAFADFVRLEGELARLLEERLKTDRTMLVSMRGGAR